MAKQRRTDRIPINEITTLFGLDPMNRSVFYGLSGIDLWPVIERHLERHIVPDLLKAFTEKYVFQVADVNDVIWRIGFDEHSNTICFIGYFYFPNEEDEQRLIVLEPITKHANA